MTIPESIFVAICWIELTLLVVLVAGSISWWRRRRRVMRLVNAVKALPPDHGIEEIAAELRGDRHEHMIKFLDGVPQALTPEQHRMNLMLYGTSVMIIKEENDDD